MSFEKVEGQTQRFSTDCEALRFGTTFFNLLRNREKMDTKKREQPQWIQPQGTFITSTGFIHTLISHLV
jgi:hypothetical protein